MAETVRCWMVERTYTDRDLVVLVYATPDGERALRKELSAAVLSGTTVTAAVDADPGDLEPVTDPETRARYAMEAERVRETHTPHEAI
jgi:hypothetical protein